jgi:hypothetical protein
MFTPSAVVIVGIVQFLPNAPRMRVIVRWRGVPAMIQQIKMTSRLLIGQNV